MTEKHPVKIYDNHDNFLGLLRLPDSFYEIISRSSTYEFAICNAVAPKNLASTDRRPTEASFTKAILSRKNPFHEYNLFFVTPEQLELIPGFYFTPGAAYVRSLIASMARDT